MLMEAQLTHSWDSGMMPLNAHLTDWLTMLKLRDKMKE